MSNYDLKILATAKPCDAAILAAKQEDAEIMSGGVPGSSLHDVMTWPIDSDADEG